MTNNLTLNYLQNMKLSFLDTHEIAAAQLPNSWKQIARLSQERTSVYIYETEITDFERVLYFENPAQSVRGIIAIHSTLRGPALGGCRISNYASLEECLNDGLQLAKAMTYKNAIVGLPYGGGKAALFQNLYIYTSHLNPGNFGCAKASGLDDRKQGHITNMNLFPIVQSRELSREPKFQDSGGTCIDKTEVFNVFHQVINFLGGIYLTADDMGTTVADMEYLRQFTPYARGIYYHGQQIPATSYGVYQALKAAHFHKTKKETLEGLRVFVQGLGKTGYALCRYLHEEGCILYVNDLQSTLVKQAIEEFNATFHDPINENILEIDIFCPCALGGSVNKQLLSKIQVSYIAGSANNQLDDPALADFLHQQGIIYVPDYLSNAGGVIDVYCEGKDYCDAYVLAEVSKIYQQTLNILRESEVLNQSPLKIANQYVDSALMKYEY